MASITASKWVITMDYCSQIRRIKWAIKANRRAIEYQRERLGIKGRAILDQVSGTKNTDSLETSIIEAIENIERITNNLELFEADYTEQIKPLERLSVEDQAIITSHFIDEPKDDPETPRLKGRPQRGGRVGSLEQDMAQVMAPYRALERLFDQLPEKLKDSLPKAI